MEPTTSTATPAPEQTSTDGLAPGRLGVAAIVFFVMSAAAPLTVVVSGAPFAVLLGGVGGPGAMLAAGVVLMLFAAGFTAMSRHVTNAAAFYAYATQGLGRVVGSATAVMTTAGYVLLLLSFYGYAAFYGQSVIEDMAGVDVPWWALGLAIVAAIGFIGARNVEVGARFLAVLLTAEVALLAGVSIAVLVRGGPEPLSLAPFDPGNWLVGPGAAALFVLAFGSYIGFEGTAIYAEEARHPHRTIPRATYVAVAFLALFYAFSFWCFVTAFGVEGVIGAVASPDFADLPFVQAQDYLGTWAMKVMEVLIVTSFLACLISFQNAASRYLFSLGREGLLPGWLGHTDPRHSSPARASHVLMGLGIATVALCAVAGWDPLLDLGLLPYAAGVASIIAAQAICAVAVVAFFARDRRGFSVFRALIAPGLGALGLLTGLYLVVSHFDIASAQTGFANVVLLTIPVLFFIGGGVRALMTAERD